MKSCLVVIDAQESFRHRPFFDAALCATWLEAQNRLIEGAVARGLPVLRVFHHTGTDEVTQAFSRVSGLVRAIEGLTPFDAAETFYKTRHSALVGTGLDVWLTQHGIGRLIMSGIRTEQCCETTTRHASDLGWQVDFVTEATLTFDMTSPDGTPVSAAAIRERTATVLQGRFAQICSVDQALERSV